MKNSMFVLDAYGLIYRSYFAFVSSPLVNSKDENVSAIYGFFRNLFNLIKEYKPECFIAAFDSKTPTFRHEIYPEYKANRAKTPEDLHSQIPTIEEILNALGIKIIAHDGFEADDIIATIASKCKKENRPCYIISSDKDLMQLIGGSVKMLKPSRNTGWELVDSEDVISQWGVPPSLMLDFLSLTGDASDNIPGIKGVGPKTATKLLTEYKNLEEIFENAEKIPGAMGKRIREGKEMAYFSKRLITLSYDLPLEDNLDSYACKNLNTVEASKLLFKAELPSIAKLYAGENLEDVHIEIAHTKYEESENKKSKTQIEEEEKTTSPFDELTYTEFQKVSGDYKMVTSEKEIEKIINDAIDQGYCSFDTETTSLDIMEAEILGISISLKAGEAFYIPLKTESCLTTTTETPETIEFDFEQKKNLEQPTKEISNQITPTLMLKNIRHIISKLFNSKSILLILHNAKYDLKVLQKNGFFNLLPRMRPESRIFDTMIAAWLLDPDWTSFSLGSLAQKFLGLQIIEFKDVVEKGKTFADTSFEDATIYAAEDADVTLRLYSIFLQMLLDENLAQLFYELEMPLVEILTDMECSGIRIEPSDLESFSKELAKDIAKTEKLIFDEVGYEFNVASPKQLQEVLFEDRKLIPSKKTKTGYSTDTSVLESLASEDIVPGLILDFRTLSKLKSTYVDSLYALADKKGRVHTSFIQTGTATGRLSSRDPNLQNIPIREETGRKIRKAFKAKDGQVLVSADYAQIELVILAHLSGDKNLCDAFNSGVDVHKKTASLIFNVLPEDVNADMRRIAKTINFGVMYGMSAFRLANELRIPRGQAASFISMYFDTYSGVAEFIENTKTKARNTGYVETLMGRRRFIKALNNSNKNIRAAAERIAVNTPIQGSAADIVKTAMIRVDKAISGLNLEKNNQDNYPLDARLLLQVHDELILECPESQAPYLKEILINEMENVVELDVPLRVNVEIGKSWGDFH